MNVIVFGGNDYYDKDAVFSALNEAHAKRPFTMVIHDTSTVGIFAAFWARGLGIAEGSVGGNHWFTIKSDLAIAFPRSPAWLLGKSLENGVEIFVPYEA